MTAPVETCEDCGAAVEYAFPGCPYHCECTGSEPEPVDYDDSPHRNELATAEGMRLS